MTQLNRGNKRKCICVFLLSNVIIMIMTFNSYLYIDLTKKTSEFGRNFTPEVIEPNSAAVHPVININGNTAMDLFTDKTGSGTELDPYIIQNFEIDGGAVASCINLTNVDRYTIIRNCKLSNFPMRPNAGIIVAHSKNIQLINCTILSSTNSRDGIYFNNITSCAIKNCNIRSSGSAGIGIHLDYVNSSIISYNNASFCDYFGIALLQSYHNSIVFNNCSKINDPLFCAIYLVSSCYNTVANNILCDNFNDGITLYSNSNNNTVSNNIVLGNTDHGIYNYDSSSNLIEKNQIQNNNYGIRVSLSSWNITITKNEISHHISSGILLQSIKGNHILVENNISYCTGKGIEFFDGNGSIIQYNRIFHCLGTGMLVSNCWDNNIQWNIIGSCGTGLNVAGTSMDNELIHNWIWGNTYNVNKSGFETDEFFGNWNVSPKYNDLDSDGLKDEEELALKTSPIYSDTDADGLDDKFELTLGTDPLEEDSDSDGYIDGLEYLQGTDPNNILSFPGSETTPEKTWIDLLVDNMVYILLGLFMGFTIALLVGRKRSPKNKDTSNTKDISHRELPSDNQEPLKQNERRNIKK